MTSLKDLQNFKGILNSSPKNNKQRIGFGVAGIIFGLALVSVSGWLLVYEFQIFKAPELLLHFPKAYIMLLVFLILGFIVVIKGVVFLLKK